MGGFNNIWGIAEPSFSVYKQKNIVVLVQCKLILDLLQLFYLKTIYKNNPFILIFFNYIKQRLNNKTI